MKKSMFFKRSCARGIAFVLLLLSLCACGQKSDLLPVHPNDSSHIDQALATEIKYAYYEAVQENLLSAYYHPSSPEETCIYIYYGNYNGCEIVLLFDPIMAFTDAIGYVNAAGYSVYFGSTTHLEAVWVYRDGVFYRVEEAYEAGLLRKIDVYEFGVNAAGERFTAKYPTPPTEEE